MDLKPYNQQQGFRAFEFAEDCRRLGLLGTDGEERNECHISVTAVSYIGDKWRWPCVSYWVIAMTATSATG
jgi:hypothetical protein